MIIQKIPNFLTRNEFMYPKFKINTLIISVLFKRFQRVNLKKFKYSIQRINLMNFIEYFNFIVF